MSAYIEFFVRRNEGEFVPVGEYSRSSAIYRAFSDVNAAPWEKITVLKADWVIESLKRDRDNYEAAIKREEQGIEDVKSLKDRPLDEITEYIWQARNSIEELNEGIKEVEDAIRLTNFYISLVDEYAGVKVYVGIEVGYNVTAEDIVK